MTGTRMLFACALSLSLGFGSAFAVELSVATFNVDATPPVGSPLCGGSVPPMEGVHDRLSARGIVLLPDGLKPIVLVSVDWVGIGNGGQTAWRAALADATDTSPDRVAVHTIHQHDAPFCDFDVEALIAEHGLSGEAFDPTFARDTIQRAAAAAKAALGDARSVSHIGIGKAKVERIASNRRILGADGKVAKMRWTSTRDPELHAAPEGVIDPWLRAVSFWDGETPLAILTYYATHPQSYYRTGFVSADFPGLARSMREKAMPETAHIHFNGAGGNVAAGKYNDGSPENRSVLAKRLYEGMVEAFNATDRFEAPTAAFAWDSVSVDLPLRAEIDLARERARLADPALSISERIGAAREIAWMEREQAGAPIAISRLRIGPLQMVHMPGELFVEYQLAAQEMAPESFVCMAAYGDYGPGYICTAEAYPQGGYEAQLRTSRVAPSVERVLMDTLEILIAQ